MSSVDQNQTIFLIGRKNDIALSSGKLTLSSGQIMQKTKIFQFWDCQELLPMRNGKDM